MFQHFPLPLGLALCTTKKDLALSSLYPPLPVDNKILF